MGCGISQSQVSEKQLHQPPQTKSTAIHSPVARSNQNNRMGVAMAGVGVGVGEANLKSLRHTVKPQTGGSGAEKEDEEQFTMVMPSANEGGLNPSSNPNMSLKSGFGGGQSMNNSFAVGGSVGSVSGVPFKGFGFAPVAGAQQQSSGRPKSTSDGNMDEEAKSVAFYCPPGVPELLVAANGPNTQHGAAEVSAP